MLNICENGIFCGHGFPPARRLRGNDAPAKAASAIRRQVLARTFARITCAKRNALQMRASRLWRKCPVEPRNRTGSLPAKSSSLQAKTRGWEAAIRNKGTDSHSA